VESIDYNNFIQLCLIPTKRIYPLPVGEISPSVYETRLASCRKTDKYRLFDSHNIIEIYKLQTWEAHWLVEGIVVENTRRWVESIDYRPSSVWCEP